MADLRIKNQKIIKIGNSYGITLDRTFFDRSQLKEGDEVIVRYDEDTKSVTFAPPTTYAAATQQPLSVAEKKAVYTTKITPELEDWTNSFIKENKEALEELANL